MNTPIKLLAFGLLFLLGCDKDKSQPDLKSGTYQLDVSNIESTEILPATTGTLIISHNAMAIFPIDLSDKNRVLTVMGPETIDELQTKAICEGNGRTALDNTHYIVRNINISPPAQKDLATITGLHIEMPYKAKQDKFKRIPENVCLGFRIRGQGWIWHFTTVEPVLDDIAQKGVADVEVEESNVDAIAILFETTTNVEKITYKVR